MPMYNYNEHGKVVNCGTDITLEFTDEFVVSIFMFEK